MKIQFLGTAAAEGIPGVFCECEVCKKTWEKGGKNIRTRCQALIDDKILIDFGPDTYMHELLYNFRLSRIDTLLITHIHEDHYYPQEFGNRRNGFAYMDGCNNLDVYGSIDLDEDIIKAMQNYGKEGTTNRFNIHYIKPGEKFISQGYEILPIKAVHGTNNPLNYIISKDGKCMLYAHDTSSYDEETWNVIKENIKHFDLVSLDCTSGIIPMRYIGHMNIERNLEFREKLISLGLADEKTICISNHFSHNGGATYDEFVEYVKDMPLEISYDGMVVEF